MPFDPPEAVNPRCGHVQCANVNACTMPWHDAERRAASIVMYAEWSPPKPHPLTFNLTARGDHFRPKRFHGAIYLSERRFYPQAPGVPSADRRCTQSVRSARVACTKPHYRRRGPLNT